MPAPPGVLLVLLALVIGLPLFGIATYRTFAAQQRLEAVANLQTVAHLKAGQISAWLVERFADGRALAHSPEFAQQVQALRAGQEPGARKVLEGRLSALREALDYQSVSLLDAAGTLLLHVGPPGQPGAEARALLARALETGDIQVLAPEGGEPGRAPLDFIVPVRTPAGDHALVLHADPRRFLDPLLRTWPTVSASGETLLLRAQPSQLRYLSAPRLQAGGQGAPPAPPSVVEDAPAMHALRARQPGTAAGPDYRGVAVLAAFQPVGHSDWVLLAKVDEHEALAPARALAGWVSLMALLSTGVLVAVALAAWRQHRRNAQMAQAAQQQRLLEPFFHLPFIGMAVRSAADGRWLRFNDRLCEILGYTREEIARTTWSEVTHPDDRLGDEQALYEMLQGGSDGYEIEKRLLHKNGSIVHCHVDVKCVRGPDGRIDHFLHTVDDITERKAAERGLMTISRYYAALSQCDEAIVRCTRESELFPAVCEAVVSVAGAGLAWVGMVDPRTRQLVAVAQAGTGADYLRGLHVSTDPAQASADRPEARAILDQRACWIDGTFEDGAPAAWREQVAAFGWNSAAALPLLRGGQAIGVLTIYLSEPDGLHDRVRKLLAKIAENISFALDVLAREAERGAAIDALQRSELRFRQVFESSIDGILMAAPDGRVLSANPAACRMLGFDESELRALGRGGPLDPADPRLAAALEERSRTGRFAGELAFLRKDGSRMPGEVSSVLYDDSFGQKRSSIIIRDITERVQTEMELRKLSMAVEQSPESIVITDTAGTIEYVNETFLRVTGYTRQEVLGRNPSILQSGGTPVGTYTEMWSALGRGEPWKGQFENRRKDGSTYTEFAIIAPIRQQDGRVTHYLAIKDDITERKRMGEELDTYRHQLEQLVDMRTAELAEARAHAEAANQAKSAFLANMSHEIRTPMNAIIGLTHLMLSAGTTPEQAARLRKIAASGRHLLSLVNDILDLSKIEAGKLVVEAAAFDLLKAVGEAFGSMALRAEEKGLEARLLPAPDLPLAVRGDALRLGQILLNLLSNAVKFTDRGGITLRVGVVHARPEGSLLRFEVTDTGIGLTEEQQAHLFKAFEQADTSTTRKYGGTGLGLAICQRLVQALGGEIGVHSTPGSGSSFWFQLPFAAATLAEVPASPVALSDRAPAPPPPGLQGLAPQSVEILLVEDDPINQEVALELLRGPGYRVAVAADGAQAVAMAQGQRYHLILMDLQMPVMDGFEATRRLRGTPAHARTPIIAMTANVFVEDQERCLAAGMDDFIAKPVDPERLMATVSRWLGAEVRSASPSPETKQAVSDWQTALARIEGMDIAAALRSVRGRWATLERLLHGFVRDHGDDGPALLRDLAARQFESVERRAHTLKGLAGTLGIRPLAAAAAQLEALLHARPQDPEPARQLAQSVAALMGHLLDQLRAVLPPPQDAPREAVDLQTLRQVVETLERLLADDDARALDLLDTHGALLARGFGAQAATLERLVRHFEFDAARERVLAALAHWPPVADGP